MFGGGGFAVTTRDPDFLSRSKYDLIALCDRLLVVDDTEAVEECVAFLEAETVRMWHGRARALMARRLKRRPLSVSQRERVIHAVLGRLVAGRFSEGFKDQLRLILYLDAERASAAARSVSSNAPEYVRRYAAWVIARAKPRLAAPGAAADRGNGDGLPGR
ncbi:hypothetical protein BH10PLA2_BH10PLA2_02910 [soil metagenome]